MKRIMLGVLVVLALGGMAVAVDNLPPLDLIGDEVLVELTTGDAVKIHGRFTNVAAQGARPLILLHMLGRTHRDWFDFAAAARAKGFCTIAIDLRGHGQSNRDKSGKKFFWKTMSKGDFRNAVHDVDAAYKYLTQYSHIDMSRVGIVGASVGANIGVGYAAKHPGAIKAVALLSPGKNYRGVDAVAAVQAYPGKMLFYSAPGDSYSYNSSKALVAMAKDRSLFRDFPGKVHGTRVFAHGGKYMSDILDWLDRNL